MIATNPTLNPTPASAPPASEGIRSVIVATTVYRPAVKLRCVGVQFSDDPFSNPGDLVSGTHPVIGILHRLVNEYRTIDGSLIGQREEQHLLVWSYQHAKPVPASELFLRHFVGPASYPADWWVAETSQAMTDARCDQKLLAAAG